MTVRIVTDSACDLPESVATDLGIEIVPLSIRFGDTEFIDRVELSTAEFWAKAATTSALPETAAPAPGAFEAVFRQAAADGATGVVVVSLSGALSATMQSAELAARSVADEIVVRVVDSRSVSLGLGTIAVACARRAAEGADVDEIAALATDLASRTQGVRCARHAREPEEGRPHRQRQGAARDGAGDQADHRGDRRQGRAGWQATNPIKGAGLPRRQGARVRRSDVGAGGAPRRLHRRRPVRRDAASAVRGRDHRRRDRSGHRHPRRDAARSASPSPSRPGSADATRPICAAFAPVAARTGRECPEPGGRHN